MQIAILGGSFNPPHVGHLMAAFYVHATRPIDEVWLIPAARHPFAKVLAPFEARVEMCEALAAESSGWLKVSRVEEQLGGEGWTVDTLEHLVATRPADRFTLVIGSDILPDLPKWRDFDRIRELAAVLVLHRAGYPAQEAVGPPMVEVSSSEIRSRLGAGQLPDGLVPRGALEVARKHRLYGLSP
jgi:nicotinate-nucleotide adenylyltransferase